MNVDTFDVGWWIESSEDEVYYGPVSRPGLQVLLNTSAISTNSLVKHCTEPRLRPVADVDGVTDGVTLAPDAPIVGDRLVKAWPKKRRERDKLAHVELKCARHKRKPAVLVCARCHQPYCNNCRTRQASILILVFVIGVFVIPLLLARMLRRQVRATEQPPYFCRRCQGSLQFRRFFAILLDLALLVYGPMLGVLLFSATTGFALPLLSTFSTQLAAAVGAVVFMFRDAIFRGAGPGKRLFGLRVVQEDDGTTPVRFGQCVVRWATVMAIPFFALVELSAMSQDPLARRHGDRWSRTRVIDTPSWTERMLRRTQRRLARRDITLQPREWLTIQQFAQIDE